MTISFCDACNDYSTNGPEFIRIKYPLPRPSPGPNPSPEPNPRPPPLNKDTLVVAGGYERCTPPSNGFNMGCKTPTYFHPGDPRLFDVRRSIPLRLDRPPDVSQIPSSFEEIYGPNLTGYGKGYKSYQDVNAGQIVYYDSKPPAIYDISSTVHGFYYRDPMGVVKPQYIRVPDIKYNMFKSVDNCLSSIRDSNEFREDLIARQQLKHNQQKWMGLNQ